MRRSFLYLLFALLSFTQCKSVSSLNTAYVYTDQNNNRYFISSEMITYDPITAAESSSGTYSGGVDASAKISEETFILISEKAENLIIEGPIREKREMLTSVISKKVNGEMKSVILSRSGLRTEFEKLLQDYLQ